MALRLPSSIADRVVLGTLLAAAVLYGADILVWKARSEPLGSVEVHRLYVMPLKGQKVQYTIGGDEQKSCAGALFPHRGLTPCWYLQRHAEERVDM